MTGRLAGKVALVTGASRGIGAETARRFAAEGASVAVSARTVEAAQSQFEGTIVETVQDIVDAGGVAEAFAADLSKPADRTSLVEAVTERFGPTDVLVNNAAVTWFDPVLDFQEKHWRLMFEVQVRAPFELSQLVLASMIERGGGAIVNISSKAGLHPDGPPFPERAGGSAVYGMVKAALERFTTGLAAEVSRHGISVNALSPTSIVATPGVVHHQLITPDREHLIEPESVMAAAALELAAGDPGVLTGRIAYSQQLLAELGVGPEPDAALLVDPHARYQFRG
ncbi:MAG: SDR family NAD(P)-dependent oxidoreductase [Actinomycetia bacterium]|nr:SDR family NAD(P)-dependent oxidoreductase [Actinomycetes bacterium]MCP3910738.1 SDR family NAD(P)-dependent oxidoreductase [Actinomycetes bacterium]MCP4084468.1 SDR family NAD(P)-dependent oxidoreductase [Actinomycetes bacterium]